jgi:hypothetical protein
MIFVKIFLNDKCELKPYLALVNFALYFFNFIQKHQIMRDLIDFECSILLTKFNLEY